MSNEAHYDLEARIAVRMGELDAKELRGVLCNFIVSESVGTVQDLARHFNVPIQSPSKAEGR